MTTRTTRRALSAKQRANGELAEKAIRNGRGFAMHRPVQVYLQLASACNLSCYMCSEHNRPPEARNGVGLISLSPEIFAQLEHDVFPWSTELFLGVGGEPTFSEHFVDYVTRAGAANQTISLITNGTYLGRSDVSEAIARNVSNIQISIDAATPENYERIRLGSRWSRLMDGFDKLQGARTRSTLSSTLTLNFVLMRSNVHELPAFIRLAHELGADAVHAQHVIAMTEPGRTEPLLLDPGLYDGVRKDSIAVAAQLGIELDLPAPFASGDREHCSVQTDGALADYKIPCREPYQTFIVLYDGRVFACCHPLAHDKMQLGNLTHQSVSEVWNHDLYRNLRHGLRTGDAPEVCRKCSIVNSPPPVIEDVQDFHNSPDIASYYADRTPPTEDSGAVSEYIEDLRRHADNLSDERAEFAKQAARQTAERAELLSHIENLEQERARERADLQAQGDYIRHLETMGPLKYTARLGQRILGVNKSNGARTDEGSTS